MNAAIETSTNITDIAYSWKLGDCLASIAVKFARDSNDWKILYQLNKKLFDRRHHKILVGDIIYIPNDWLPIKDVRGYDHTKVAERNQDLRRESFLLQMYGYIAEDKALQYKD